MNKSIWLYTLVFTAVSFSSVQAASIDYYTSSNQADWFTRAQNAQGYTTETFTGVQLNQSSLSFSSVGDGAYIGSNNAGFDAFYARPIKTSGGYTTWNFLDQISYFGADFNLKVPGGPGSGLQVVLDWTGGTSGVWLPEITRTTGGSTFDSLAFWGIFSDTPFQTVTFMSGTQAGTAEAYYMDNIVYQTPAAVPEPSTLLLFGLGSGVLALSRRMKK